MKKIILLIIAMFALMFSISNVSAAEIIVDGAEVDGAVEVLANISADCNSMFGNPKTDGSLAYYLQLILDVIKYAGIVLCIVLTVVDFFKALLGDDKEMYKPLAKTAFTRLGYAVMLFFLPAVVRTILLFLGAYDTCGIS